MKKIFTILVILILAGAGYYYWSQKSSSVSVVVTNSPTSDYKNISYNIEGEDIKLTNGTHDEPAASDSSAIVTTEYFGNEVTGDFNGDGIQDVAFILVQSGGGTGVFYYVVAALKTANGGYQGTDGVFIGDRIAPQTTEFKNGEIIVNYADRKPDEPFSAIPSVGVSKYFKVNSGQLVEVPD